MGIISEGFNTAFRDFSVALVPASGAHEPIKSEIRALGVEIEAGIAAAALSGTDLDAAMALVAPLLETAQEAEANALTAAGSAQQSYTLAKYATDNLPGFVEVRLDAAVADATVRANSFATQASAARDQAQLAAASSFANARYYPTQAAGEAATPVGQLFSHKDGGNNLVFRERTGGGSVVVNPGPYASLTGAQTLTNKLLGPGTQMALNGSRFGITSEAVGFAPQALVNIINNNSTTNGLRVTSYWQGETGTPYQNNDNSLWETFNKVVSDSENYSWSISAPNAYNNIPVGVHDSGERVGVYGWATSVNIPGQYVHAGRLRSQIGVRGRAGFQGDANPSPNTARIDKAVGVLGEIRGDSLGAEIETARAGEFISAETATTLQNNVAVYADAQGGVETNWSFYGNRGRLLNVEPIIVGSYTAAQAGGQFVARSGPNALEFGNADPGGYVSVVGATAASGKPFLALHAEAMPTGNTFRTRGKKGVVVSSDGLGALVFSRVTNANAPNQGLTDSGFFDADGKLVLLERLRPLGAAPANAAAPGSPGEIAIDGSYIYRCTADNSWQRAPLPFATW